MQINKAQANTVDNRTTGTYNSAQLGKEDFLRLLVTQLRYQDPLEPVKEQEFIAQLAQFSTLEGINNLANHMEILVDFGEALLWQSTNQEAIDMLGRQVTLVTQDGEITGSVSGIRWYEGRPRVIVDGQAYDLGYVRELALAPEKEGDDSNE